MPITARSSAARTRVRRSRAGHGGPLARRALREAARCARLREASACGRLREAGGSLRERPAGSAARSAAATRPTPALSTPHSRLPIPTQAAGLRPASRFPQALSRRLSRRFPQVAGGDRFPQPRFARRFPVWKPFPRFRRPMDEAEEASAFLRVGDAPGTCADRYSGVVPFLALGSDRSGAHPKVRFTRGPRPNDPSVMTQPARPEPEFHYQHSLAVLRYVAQPDAPA